ncbi:MAG: pyridoxal-phosphate dependent enzyme [Eubacteriales bacterium]|nr:pyridoxal-phosphate dependent enzyme [Eubacteriales bacterium]
MNFPATPIQRLYTDSRGNTLWMKRDDLLPFSFGGNKARIAAELMADMKAQGKNHMIAYGNARSNLCRVLSNLCAMESVPCTILSPADDDGSRQLSYNLLMSRFFGAEIVPCLKTDVASAVDAAFADSRKRGLRPYYLYGDRTGGGNLEPPTRAYQKVWQELQAQQKAMGIVFDELFHASATGMTQSGLLVGQALYGGETHIHGISVARDEASGIVHIKAYLSAALGRADAPISFIDRYALGYGQYTAEMVDCTAGLIKQHGIPLDLTYTGKAFYGMLQEIQRRELANKQILFLHTGGTPLFFDKAEEILQ